jgi:conserved hypothetical protein (putative transposase or invertase)
LEYRERKGEKMETYDDYVCKDEDLQRLRGLRPIDDDFMRVIFKDNIPLAQFVLRIITGINDLVIIKEETQYDMKRLVGSRSICLDVYATDNTGKLYDLEIQRADSGAQPKRARYHSSAMDVENLSSGHEFEELPDTYTIFITEHDVFGAGKAIYPIERINLATGEIFQDGEHILYVNGAYDDDSEIGKLMHDFRCTQASEMIYSLLAEKTRYYKENPKGVVEMCKAMEEMRNKTALEKAKEIATNLIKLGKITIEDIALTTGLSVKQIQELANSQK